MSSSAGTSSACSPMGDLGGVWFKWVWFSVYGSCVSFVGGEASVLSWVPPSILSGVSDLTGGAASNMSRVFFCEVPLGVTRSETSYSQLVPGRSILTTKPASVSSATARWTVRSAPPTRRARRGRLGWARRLPSMCRMIASRTFTARELRPRMSPSTNDSRSIRNPSGLPLLLAKSQPSESGTSPFARRLRKNSSRSSPSTYFSRPNEVKRRPARRA